MDNRQIRDAYDRRAARYDATMGRNEQSLTGNFRTQFGSLLRGDTLEIAIGSGLNLPYYSPQVSRAVGIDLSQEMLGISASRARELRRAIDLVAMDAQHLAFADNTFDTVAISLALCTVPDPALAVREMNRVCQPGGRIVLLEHVRSPVWPVAMIQKVLSPLQEWRVGCHLARETMDIVRECGLMIEREDQRLLGIFRLAVARPLQ